METQADNTKEKRASGKKQKLSIPYILGGSILTEDFVKKQAGLLIMIAILFVLFISNRYSCLKKITEIEDLNRKLRDIRYENLLVSTKLTTHIRQSQIEEWIQSKGLNLSGSKTPPFEIKK